MLLEQVDECNKKLSMFPTSEKSNNFSKGKDYLDFESKYLVRTIIVHK
jgi:hypothetical protein